MDVLYLPDIATAGPQSHDNVRQAIQRLASIIRDENAAMRGMDFARAGALLSSKCAAADALEAVVRAATAGALANDVGAILQVGGVGCLTPLMAENEKLRHGAARLQRRVHTLVERMVGRAGSRPQTEVTTDPCETTH